MTLPKLDVLFASLPTGASAEVLARVPKDVKIVDIGGDHRYAEGVRPGRRLANPDGGSGSRSPGESCPSAIARPKCS